MKSAVFVVTEIRPRNAPFALAIRKAGNVEVLEGLDDEDVVVVVGQSNLKNGSKVSVINAPDN